MLPTLDDFLASGARWNGEHHGVHYELSWHGRSEYQESGIWCWYIIVTDEQFYPEEWTLLRLKKQDRELNGSWHRFWSYEDFPDVDPHGGWTFGEQETYLGKDGKKHEKVKVGCDYAHSWDRDGGYWHGRADIERDVKASIEKLLKLFPRRRVRCAYSGKWDDADKFFTTNAGWQVHVDSEAKAAEMHHNWRRAERVQA